MLSAFGVGAGPAARTRAVITAEACGACQHNLAGGDDCHLRALFHCGRTAPVRVGLAETASRGEKLGWFWICHTEVARILGAKKNAANKKSAALLVSAFGFKLLVNIVLLPVQRGISLNDDALFCPLLELFDQGRLA